MLKKLREKCAFTLVELIVVLVILAILAALLVPALTGYIDKSRKSQVIAETRALHEAIQTEMVELYASSAWQSNSTLVTVASATGSEDQKEKYHAITSLSEVPSLVSGNGRFLGVVNRNGQVHCILYDNGKGYLGLYFNETQEYMAIKASEAPDTNTYFETYANCVIVTNIVDPKNDPQYSPWTRDNFLLFIGYTHH